MWRLCRDKNSKVLLNYIFVKDDFCGDVWLFMLMYDQMHVFLLFLLFLCEKDVLMFILCHQSNSDLSASTWPEM